VIIQAMFLFLLLSAAQAGEAIFLDNARIWDGTNAPPTVGDVLVIGDRIVGVGPELSVPERARVVDLRGKTLLPGLIDSHVHIGATPGSDLRGDSMEQRVIDAQHGLRATLACGFTTVLDTGIPHEFIPMFRQWEDEGRAMPEVLFLGMPLSPPDGYVIPVYPDAPSFDTAEELSAHLDELEALGAVGMKLTMEEGFVRPIWPLHSPEMQVEISNQTRSRGMPIYTHAFSTREMQLAMKVGSHAIVHPPQSPNPGLLSALAETQTYVMSTITVSDMFLIEHETDRHEGPWIELRVPASQLSTAIDPEDNWAAHAREVSLPGLPTILHGLVERGLHSRLASKRRSRLLQRSVLAMHHAGVPLILGSDAGNWTLLPFGFHGVSSVRELELLGEAGLSPVEALIAATSRPAEMLGMADEIGRIAPGMRADLVIVNGDPLVDLSTIRDLVGVMHSGELRSPEEWMETR
jgi:cytosine/adenosine deaminase-related metal-dependent hydrolase